MNISRERLFYYLPGPVAWTGALERACRAQGVAAQPVPSERTGCTVAALLGLPSPAPSVPAPPPPGQPVLLLCGFSQVRLEAFVDALAAAGVPPVLKAVVTPTNLGWTFSALARELARERRSLGG